MKCIYDVTTSKTVVLNIVKNGVSTVFKLMVKLSPHPNATSSAFRFLLTEINIKFRPNTGSSGLCICPGVFDHKRHFTDPIKNH